MNERILVIDDITLIGRNIKQILDANGFHVDIASRPIFDTDQLRQYQLILLDLFFPEGDSLPLVKKLQDLSIPTILITSFQDKEKIWSAIEMGIIDVLYKPLDVEQLKRSVEEALLDPIPLKNKGYKLVLIVSDDTLLLDQAAVQLQNNSSTVIQAHSGREALRILQEKQPTISIIDAQLPDTDGIYLIQGLQKIRSQMTLLSIVDDLDQQSLETLHQSGIENVTREEIHKQTLKDKVETLYAEQHHRLMLKPHHKKILEKFSVDPGEYTLLEELLG